jgi:serine phosphatase RsbU (regulator of sigma subunit)
MIDVQGGITARYLEYGDGANERLLAHPLVIDDELQGTVLVAQPINNLFQVRQDIQIALFVFAGVVALISVLLGAAAFVTFARPLANLTEATNRISGGALEQRVDSPYFLFKDEITVLSENFNRMTERLQEMYATQEQRVREQERVEHELRVARRIQQLLLPKEMPMLQGWQMSAFYQPARAVGGDFYDYLALPDQRIGIVIGDVTDKGMPAALVMATTRSTLRAAALRVGSPGEALRRTNELLCPEIPPNMFVTCLYAILDPLSGHMKFANAGHNLPYCRMGRGVAKLRATGMPLGLMPDMVYEEGEAQLTPGDTLLLYSDGIVEAHNPKREMFSGDRLQNFLQAYRGEDGLIEDLMRELNSFTGVGWEQEDDVTLVTLQRSLTISKN